MALVEGMDRFATVSRTVPVCFCSMLRVVLRNMLGGTETENQCIKGRFFKRKQEWTDVDLALLLALLLI